jgi:hypothetical protein
MFALVIERVVLGLVVIYAVHAVEEERALFEAVPQAEDDVHEFVAALVAQGVWVEAFAIEIIAGLVVVGGYDVPAGAAAA